MLVLFNSARFWTCRELFCISDGLGSVHLLEAANKPGTSILDQPCGSSLQGVMSPALLLVSGSLVQ